MQQQPEPRCPSCGSDSVSKFYYVAQTPVHSCIMLDTEKEALEFPTRPLSLGACRGCGFIFNTLFDSRVQEYTSSYEDQQSYSPTFNSFADRLASNLVERHNLQNKHIVEIGCSKGDFLLSLCEKGNNTGVGIDPSCVPGRVDSPAADRVKFISEYYSEKHAEHVGDLICCRHTLEHIYPTAGFMTVIRKTLTKRPNCVVMFELPDTTRILKDKAFWDIYYEHCSYFTPGSLARLFRHCGFEVTNLEREYDDQYLLIEAKPANFPSKIPHELEEMVDETQDWVTDFVTGYSERIQRWRTFFKSTKANNSKVAIWGSGSKCVSFMSTVGLRDEIAYVVDINPHRHGKYAPGVGKQIKPPEHIKVERPDTVIVMNPIYADEIGKQIRQMGVTTNVVPLQ